MLSWHDISFRPRIKLQSVEVAREVLASHADVLRVRHAFLPHERRAGTRDEPLRTSAFPRGRLGKCPSKLVPRFSLLLSLGTGRREPWERGWYPDWPVVKRVGVNRKKTFVP